ncbi:calcium-binding protein NCS-1 [Caerostris extrusa]|uniref:Calcium-binding protein NCS-1 n=1 Tax=Caerostris extrusa TaxID=172846 RepID=A0AAV4SUH9_CAEEX|nr:calcium-binding protein NCS-1 [Caerostris extrusa]
MHGKDGDTAERDAAQNRVDELFTKLDTDRDGKLSREEFCKGFKNDAWIIKALLMKSPPGRGGLYHHPKHPQRRQRRPSQDFYMPSQRGQRPTLKNQNRAAAQTEASVSTTNYK